MWTNRLFNRGLTLTAVKFLPLVHQLNRHRKKIGFWRRQEIENYQKLSKITDSSTEKIFKPSLNHFKTDNKTDILTFLSRNWSILNLKITILHQFWAFLWFLSNLDWAILIWDHLYFLKISDFDILGGFTKYIGVWHGIQYIVHWYWYQTKYFVLTKYWWTNFKWLQSDYWTLPWNRFIYRLF